MSDKVSGRNARVSEVNGFRVAYVNDFALSYSDLQHLKWDHEWMRQKTAVEFFGIPKRTIQSWVHRYGIRKRVNVDGFTEYYLQDLQVAWWRSRHRGAFPPWHDQH